jgi:ATP-dependent Clp protease ATP-binding subunit ClpC
MMNKREFFFYDPRLHMTVFGRQLTRIVTVLSYFLLSSVTALFLVSDLNWLRALGMFILLFLLDRMLHFRQGDESISDLPPSGRVNIATTLSDSAFSAIEDAFDWSAITKENFNLHLLRELQKRADIKDALRRLDIPAAEFIQKTEELIEVSRFHKVEKPERLLAAETVVRLAFRWALRENHRFIDPGALFAGLARVEDEPVLKLFSLFSIRPEDAERAVTFGIAKRELRRKNPHALREIVFGGDRNVRHRIMNRAWTSRPTPTLDQFSEDLTDLARTGRIGFMIGHEEEHEHLIQVIARPIHPNALLVGEPGVGSEVIVNHLAFNIVKDKVPAALFDKRLVRLDISVFVANAEGNALQERIQKVVGEIRRAGNIILFIPDLHLLVRTSGKNFLSAADALLPVITSDAFPVIGATFPREFQEAIEPRSDFLAAFDVIPVLEISLEDAERILTYKAVLWEAEKKIFISFGAIQAAVEIAHEFVSDKLLPGSAEELLKSALVAAEAGGEREIGPDLVRRVISSEMHIPLRAAEGAEADELLRLEEHLHERVIGQDEAVQAVSESLRQYRSGLSERKGPIASFLFVGPTGVGKTELAKSLAALHFGSEDDLLRFDMSEFRDTSSLGRLLGAPGSEGSLTEAVRRRPHSVILLDEFEEASGEIQNLFLQVLDDGRLTDGFGRTVSFDHAIVIMTSNAHSEIILSALREGESAEHVSEYVKRRLSEIFKPELLNRFSRIVVFRDLSLGEVKRIATLQLAALGKQCAAQGVSLVIEETAVTEIAKRGYDRAFGVRPLRRAISTLIREPLAKKLLAGRARKGGSIRVLFENGEFRFVTSLSYVEDVRSDA